jgi:hypothetical protein
LIQPNYLEDPEDVATLVAGIKVALKMLDTEVFKKNKLSLITDDFFCGNFEPMSDDYFECFVRHWMTTVYHPSGTCKMGPKNDAEALPLEKCPEHCSYQGVCLKGPPKNETRCLCHYGYMGPTCKEVEEAFLPGIAEGAGPVGTCEGDVLVEML